jgi:hypothetical protein
MKNKEGKTALDKAKSSLYKTDTMIALLEGAAAK